MLYIIPTDTCFGIACSVDDSKSYDKIYSIKKRSYLKPLVVMVESFEWLEKNTDLNKDQINFIKNYKKPFTVLTDSLHFKAWLNYEDKDNRFANKNEYKLIAFRVAHNNIQKKLIKKVGPLFLTSANLSNKLEIYDEGEIIKQFGYYIDKKRMKLISDGDLDSSSLPSDIFEFVGDSLEIKYLRQNGKQS